MPRWPMWRAVRTSLLLGACLVAAATNAAAQEGSRAPDLPVMEPQRRAPPWEHRALGFVGATREEDADAEVAFTLGLDYERRFHEWYGVGAFAQAPFGTNRTFIIGPAFSLHPVSNLRVSMAPSAERSQDDWAFNFRLGFDYAFTLRTGWVIVPSLALDFARGNRIFVLGASAGRVF